MTFDLIDHALFRVAWAACMQRVYACACDVGENNVMNVDE